MTVLWLFIAAVFAIMSIGFFAVWVHWNNPDTTWAEDDEA